MPGRLGQSGEPVTPSGGEGTEAGAGAGLRAQGHCCPRGAPSAGLTGAQSHGNGQGTAQAGGHFRHSNGPAQASASPGA